MQVVIRSVELITGTTTRGAYQAFFGHESKFSRLLQFAVTNDSVSVGPV